MEKATPEKKSEMLLFTLIKEVRQREEERRSSHPKFWRSVFAIAIVGLLISGIGNSVAASREMQKTITPEVNQERLNGLEQRIDAFRDSQLRVLNTLQKNENRITRLETTYGYNNTLLMTLCVGLGVLLFERLAYYFPRRNKH